MTSLKPTQALKKTTTHLILFQVLKYYMQIADQFKNKDTTHLEQNPRVPPQGEVTLTLGFLPDAHVPALSL